MFINDRYYISNLQINLYFIIFMQHNYYYIYYNTILNACTYIDIRYYFQKIIRNYLILWLPIFVSEYVIYKKLFLYKLCVTKIHFRYRGAWIWIYSSWPYINIFRFGYSHPIHLYADLTSIRVLRRYLHYSAFLVFNLFYTKNYFNYLLTMRYFNKYIFNGLKRSRSFILKRIVSISQDSYYKV